MRRFVPLCIVCLSVLASFGAGCSLIRGGVWSQPRSAELILPMQAPAGITVTTHNGSISYAAQEGGWDSARLVATYRGKGRDWDDAERACDAVTPFCEAEGADGVLVGWRWSTEKERAWSAEVGFALEGPGGVRLDLRTHNGKVTVTGAAGATAIKTHNGGIEAETTGSELAATTHNGSVHVRFGGEKLSLVTHNGGIEADLSRSGTLSGSIRTHNGGVRLRLTDGCSVALSCRTRNGSVKCRLPLEDRQGSRSRLSGRLGGGEGRLAVETHNGGIRLEPLD